MHGRRLLGLALALLALGATTLAGAASADRATVSPDAPQPWAGGAATLTPIEAVAARIASRIAGHPVTVSCEGVPRFRASDGTDASGLVQVHIDAGNRTLAATSTLIELTSTVCGPLQRFAQAAQKPTRCLDAGRHELVPCFSGTTVARGSRAPTMCWATACYAVAAARYDWKAYGGYADAILTLAHEAIHTQQAVAGRAVPGPDLVEAQADCSGMQWMPWVAVQLGDSAADAQSIAEFYWHAIYPQEASEPATRRYWSADCRPGGKLDVRAADATAWP